MMKRTQINFELNRLKNSNSVTFGISFGSNGNMPRHADLHVVIELKLVTKNCYTVTPTKHSIHAVWISQIRHEKSDER